MTRYFPVLATALIECASLGQIIKMFQVRSSESQSATSYLLLIVALVLFERFYAIETPDQRPALWTARVSIFVNACVLAAVLFFRA